MKESKQWGILALLATISAHTATNFFSAGNMYILAVYFAGLAIIDVFHGR